MVMRKAKFGLKLTSPQNKLFSRFFEDAAKGIFLSVVVGYFLPSVLPSATRPTGTQAFGGGFVSLISLSFAAILIRRVKENG